MALRAAFEEADIRRGESLVNGVDGELDEMGGAIATVEDAVASWHVCIMPALRDANLLLIACECTAAGDPACEHAWAVLRVIDARGILAQQSHKRALFDRVFEDSAIIKNLSVDQLRSLLE